MRKFFKKNTLTSLYCDLSLFAVGNQMIRQTNTLDRLLAAKELLDEKKAQKDIRDITEQVHGFDISREYETIYAKQGIVIAPLHDDFKKELASFRFG